MLQCNSTYFNFPFRRELNQDLWVASHLFSLRMESRMSWGSWGLPPSPGEYPAAVLTEERELAESQIKYYIRHGRWKKTTKPLESNMRQIPLEINHSCSNRLRVQIIPQLYTTLLTQIFVLYVVWYLGKWLKYLPYTIVQGYQQFRLAELKDFFLFKRTLFSNNRNNSFVLWTTRMVQLYGSISPF